MEITLSVIKADIGGYVGHSGPHTNVMCEANRCLERAQKREALITGIKPGESRQHYATAQNPLADAFTGNVRGMGSDVAKMEFAERMSEPVSILMADKNSTGAWNVPLCRIFAAPFNIIRLVITPGIHFGFTFRVHDEQHTSARVEGKAVLQSTGGEDEQRLCFVIMPFRSCFNGVYAVIKRVARARGMTCRRADEVIGQGPIMDKIWSLISSAEVVIADITENNCNVYHEVGIARALGKTPILLWAEGGDPISSDLVGLEYIKYENLIDGDRELSWRLGMAIDDIMKGVAS